MRHAIGLVVMLVSAFACVITAGLPARIFATTGPGLEWEGHLVVAAAAGALLWLVVAASAAAWLWAELKAAGAREARKKRSLPPHIDLEA